MSKKWRHSVLPKTKVMEYIEKWRSSLRVEVYDRSPHLEVLSTHGFKTLGRINKGLWKSLKETDAVLMDKQPGYVNVTHYKFKPLIKTDL